MKRLMKLLIILPGLILLAIIFKPNYTKFKDFCSSGGDPNGPYLFSPKKTADYLLFAIYEKGIYVRQSDNHVKPVRTEKYYGYLLNFHLASGVENG